MAHESNSPSVFFRRRACPGSKRLEAGLPGSDTEHSLRGSAAHAVVEACLSENEHVTDYRDTDVVVTKQDRTTTTVKIQEDDLKAIQAGVDYVHLRQQQGGWEVDCFYEEKVTPSLWLNRPNADCDGTLDIGMIHDQWIEIADYKHGAGIAVDAINNDQLLEYMIGFLQKIDWTNKDQNIPCRMTIIQPRAQHPDGPVRTWEVPAYEIFAKIPEMAAIAAATDDPNAPLVPGDHCRFCKANPCEAVTAAATAVFKPVDAPQAASAEPVDWNQAETDMGRPPELLGPAELAAILDRAALMKAWIKAVEEKAAELARAGTAIPGHKLVRANTRRKYGEPDEVIIKKLMGMRDTRDTEGKKKFAKADVTRVVPISITTVEKEVKPYVSDRQWKTFSQYIIKPEGAPVLVPDTDSRPAIKSAEEVFQPVTEPAAKAPWE